MTYNTILHPEDGSRKFLPNLYQTLYQKPNYHASSLMMEIEASSETLVRNHKPGDPISALKIESILSAEK
jgi:hypothetical protein